MQNGDSAGCLSGKEAEGQPGGLLAYLGPAGSQQEAGPTAGEASREGNRRQKGTSWMGTARLEGSRGPEGQVSERRMALGCL